MSAPEIVKNNNSIFEPIDILYNEYQKNGWNNIKISNEEFSDSETTTLIRYINAIKNKEIKFDDIPLEKRKKIADIICKS